MDIWTVIRTILEKSPAIKAKELIEKVGAHTNLSRSTIYDHLASFELRGKIYREKGRYWLPGQKKKAELRLDETIRSFIWKETDEISHKLAQAQDLGDYREAYERAMLLANRLGVSTEQYREEEKRILTTQWSIDRYQNRRIQRYRLQALTRVAVSRLLKQISELILERA